MQSNLEQMSNSYEPRFNGSPEYRIRPDALTREPSPPTVSSFRTRAVIAAVTVLGICYFFPATIAYFVAAATAFGVYKGLNYLNNRRLSEQPSSTVTESDHALHERYDSTSEPPVELNNNNSNLSMISTYGQIQGALSISDDTDHEDPLIASQSHDPSGDNNDAHQDVGIIFGNAPEGGDQNDTENLFMESRSSRASSLGRP